MFHHQVQRHLSVRGFANYLEPRILFNAKPQSSAHQRVIIRYQNFDDAIHGTQFKPETRVVPHGSLCSTLYSGRNRADLFLSGEDSMKTEWMKQTLSGVMCSPL